MVIRRNEATRAKLLAKSVAINIKYRTRDIKMMIKYKVEDARAKRYKCINPYTGEIETSIGAFKARLFYEHNTTNSWVPIKYYNQCESARRILTKAE